MVKQSRPKRTSKRFVNHMQVISFVWIEFKNDLSTFDDISFVELNLISRLASGSALDAIARIMSIVRDN